jgi:coenzyme F420-reducing hydrogenase beta subunit
MGLNENGQYEPFVSGSAHANELQRVCPFSNQATDETTIARRLFGAHAVWHDQIGYHLNCYAGFVKEGKFRARGSSGGLGKWIGYELMRRGLVDAIVQVAADPTASGGEVLYRYSITRDTEATKHASRSVYYPVEFSEVVREMKEVKGRYVVVGVPCFIKALRLLSERDDVLAERLSYCVGLVCGHLKSSFYAEMLAWQEGIGPGELEGVDFRKKYPGAAANEKGMEFVRTENGEVIKSGDIVQKYFGTRYAVGFFKYNACDYCDDVVAETADIVVGDAWLPEYKSDGAGTNLLIVRNKELLGLVEEGMEEGRLALLPITADRAAQSQAGGFRHRRDGLAYRLHLKDKAGEWRPTKRVEASAEHLNRLEKKKYLLRSVISTKSFGYYKEAKRRGVYKYFEVKMAPLVDKYDKVMALQASGLGEMSLLKMSLVRGVRFCKRSARWIARKLGHLSSAPNPNL